jgi:tetratricopeptide (TPR) repeat protein
LGQLELAVAAGRSAFALIDKELGGAVARGVIGQSDVDLQRQQLLNFVASTFQELQEEESAKRAYAKSCRLTHGESFDHHVALGRQYATAGQVGLAVEAYNAALRENPASAEASFELGTAYLDHSRLYQARDAFVRATQLQPLSADNQFFAGITLASTARFDAARDALVRFTELAPAWRHGYGTLGTVCGAGARWNEARDALSRAVELLPSDPTYRQKLGLACLAIGDMAGAEQQAQALPLHSPDRKILDRWISVFKANTIVSLEGCFKLECTAGTIQSRQLGIGMQLQALNYLGHKLGESP